MKQLPVETVFKILTSGSIPQLVRVLDNLVSMYISINSTSIGIYSPSGYSLLIAGTTDTNTETASLVNISNNYYLLEVLHDRHPVLLQPYSRSSSISNIKEINSMLPPGNLIFPMEINNMVLGILILNSDAPPTELTEEKIEAIGDISISASHALVSIHERDSYKTEQERLGAEVESLSGDYLEARFYEELFMNNPDGLVVMDFQGGIIHSNPAAEALLCKDGNPLPDNFMEIVEDEEKPGFQSLLKGFQDGIYLRNFDLPVVLQSRKRAILSVSISLVPQRDGYVLLALRDVTQERTLEKQLSEAKAFMENLINSSVDAIMAADMKGTIVLYNEAAGQLSGYEPSEVIGRKNVQDFYPPGQAKEIMRKLRSSDYGGRGRLEHQRVWIISKHGESIPVSLSAAIIYDGDKEIYTCGIFSDLREKIRSEEKMALIAEKLQESQRQAGVAELAAAMAHELNQPLTSIYGCGELLMRRLSTDQSYQRYVKIILDEASKMSEIIKKIGRITRFETQSYVGASTIVDIDSSSGKPPSEEEGGKTEKSDEK